MTLSHQPTPSTQYFEGIESLLASLHESVYLAAHTGEFIHYGGQALNLEPEEIASIRELARFHTTESHAAKGQAGPMYATTGEILLPRFSPAGSLGIWVLLSDITELQSTRFELTSTIEHASILSSEYRALEEAMPDAYVLVDEDGAIQVFNRRAEALFDCSADDVMGAPSAVLSPDPEAWSELLARGLAADGEAVVVELQGRRKSGETFPMGVSLTRVPGLSGVYQSAILRDLTPIRERELELTQARARAEAAAEAKSEFLANMSHEIRTPMNGVIGMLSFLLESSLAEDQREWAATAHDSAQLLLTIINDILDFSKLEAGKLKIDPTPFCFRQLASDCVNLMGAQMQDKSLKLNLDLDNQLAGGYLADRGRVRQIMLNYLSNAVKFTPRGEVSVRVRVLSIGAGPRGTEHKLRVEVEDQGIGIPANVQNLIFQKFMQAESSTTRRFGGTGLGLAISKELVELMGGRVGLESQEGVGSIFWFELVLPTARLVPASNRGWPAMSYPPPSRVLLVDDNLVNQKVARRVLEKFGCVVELANNGREAVEAAGKGGYDVVFMDCQMPEMDGFEATRILKAAQATSALPIVAMTANAMAGDREQCLQAGMDDFLTKPVNATEVLTALKRWTKTQD